MVNYILYDAENTVSILINYSEMRDTMDNQKEITYINNISVEDYNALRKSVNWINVTEKRAAIALKNSFYLCVAVCDGKPVGMARIVSDGGYTYFITDVIVHPDYQGCHIGTELIRRELDYIQKDVVAGETVMVSLMAAYHRESFYEKFGFHTRPFGNHGPGMSMWVSRDVTGNPMTFLKSINMPSLYKLIHFRIVSVINRCKFVLKFIFINIQRFTQLIKIRIKIPELCIYITKQHNRIL